MRSSVHCVGRTYASHSQALCRAQAYAYVSVLPAVTNGVGIQMSQRDWCSVQCLRGDNSWSTEACEQLQNCPATHQCLHQPVTLNMKPDHSFYEQNKGRNNPLAIEGMANYH